MCSQFTSIDSVKAMGLRAFLLQHQVDNTTLHAVGLAKSETGETELVVFTRKKVKRIPSMWEGLPVRAEVIGKIIPV